MARSDGLALASRSPRRSRLRLGALLLLAAATQTTATVAAPRSWDAPTNTSCTGGCECKRRLMVCIPTAPSKDMAVFYKSLASVAQYIKDADSIVVVSRKDALVDDAIAKVGRAFKRVSVQWFDEDGGHFPFNYSSIRAEISRLSKKKKKGAYVYAVGWYLQQLLKLYCGRAVDRASSTEWSAPDYRREPDFDTLVVDSDVVFLRDVSFLRASQPSVRGECSATYDYAFSREGHRLYHETNALLLGKRHASRLDSNGRVISGVAHHMVLRAEVIAAIERDVEAAHNKTLWEALLGPGSMLISKPKSNAFSEYELYFHYARRHFPSTFNIRQLYWANGPGQNAVVDCSSKDGWPIDAQRLVKPGATNDEAAQVDFASGYDYVAYHSYAKQRPCVYAPAWPSPDTGACFGGGCALLSSASTHSSFKRRDDPKFAARDRTLVAPRLCAPH